MEVVSEDIRKQIEVLKTLIEKQSSKEIIKEAQQKLNLMLQKYLDD